MPHFCVAKRARRVSPRPFRHTKCGIRLRHICFKAARICAPYNRCSVTPIWGPPKSIRASRKITFTRRIVVRIRAPRRRSDNVLRVRPYFIALNPQKSENARRRHVPHAGLDVPPHFANHLLAPARSIARAAALLVDELYEGVTEEGATLIASRVSRYVVDLNRAESDVDAESVAGAPASPRAPRGVVWRLTTDNEKCLAAPLTPAELDARLDEIYRPYHAALAAAIRGKLERFGVCVLLAGHSMPSVGRSGHGDASVKRADVVPGTQGRTTAAPLFVDLVERHAHDAGLSVKHDEPYRGGYTTRHWGRPSAKIHAVQVEIARRLYMDEGALRKSPAFPAMRDFVRALVRKLGAAARA